MLSLVWLHLVLRMVLPRQGGAGILLVQLTQVLGIPFISISPQLPAAHPCPLRGKH